MANPNGTGVTGIVMEVPPKETPIASGEDPLYSAIIPVYTGEEGIASVANPATVVAKLVYLSLEAGIIPFLGPRPSAFKAVATAINVVAVRTASVDPVARKTSHIIGNY